MEPSGTNTRVNVPEIIKKINQGAISSSQKETKTIFPYVETYLKNTNGEKYKLSHSSKFRESFIHTDTLKFNNPHFSFKKIFDSMEKLTLSPAPKNTRISKAALRPEKILTREVWTSKNIVITGKSENCKCIKDSLSQKSKIRKALNKSTRIKTLPKLDGDRISPDILRINRLGCRSMQKGEMARNMMNYSGIQESRSRTGFVERKGKKIVIEIDGTFEVDETEYTMHNDSRFSDAFIGTEL